MSFDPRVVHDGLMYGLASMRHTPEGFMAFLHDIPPKKWFYAHNVLSYGPILKFLTRLDSPSKMGPDTSY